MNDQRRVCDLTAAELLDAAAARYVDLGWTRGHWRLEWHLDDGVTRKLVNPTLLDAVPVRVTIGRRQLERRGDSELGTAA